MLSRGQSRASLYKLGRHEAATDCYDYALMIDPQSKFAWSSKGIALNNLDRHEAAAVCYDHALEIDPRDAVVWFRKGNTLYYLGRYVAAIGCYKSPWRSTRRGRSRMEQQGLRS